MLQRLRISIFVLLASTSSVSYAADELCSAGNLIPHDLGDYKFTTSSWIEDIPGGYFFYTCVHNDSNRSLWFDWFIPGPRTYVPDGADATSHRFFEERIPANINGCAQYGNYYTPTRIDFTGHKSDLDRVKEDCSVREASLQRSGNELDVDIISASFTVYAPSDSENVDATIVKLDFGSVLEFTDDTFTSILYYGATPWSEDTFEGDIDRIKLSPQSDSLRKIIADMGVMGSDLIHQIGEKGEIKFTSKLPDSWHVDNVEYAILDRHNVLVSQFLVPMVVESE